MVGQFLPSLLGGAIITASFVHLSAALVPLLPGIWAICFGIGTFASRPYLPRASGHVALFYYVAGVLLLWIARGPEPLAGWWVGGTFGSDRCSPRWCSTGTSSGRTAIQVTAGHEEEDD